MFIDENSLFGVIDLETTGFDPSKDRIVESASLTTSKDVTVIAYHSLHDPQIPIPPSASAVHHLTDADIVGKQPFDNEEFAGLCESRIIAWAAHFAEFERGFLKLQKPVICTLRLAKRLWGGLESYSNSFLRYYFKLEGCENVIPHRALGDVIVTAAILRLELKELIAKRNGAAIDIKSLVEWIEEPFLLDTISFGMHKGKRWEELPKDYLRWIVTKMKEPEPDRDTLHTAKYYLNG